MPSSGHSIRENISQGKKFINFLPKSIDKNISPIGSQNLIEISQVDPPNCYWIPALPKQA